MSLKRWWDDLSGRKPYGRYLEKEDRGRRLKAQSFSVLATLAGIVYLYWLFFRLNLDAWWLSIPYFVSELAGLFIFMCFAYICWYPRYHREHGIPIEQRYTVDIFITVCGEPFDIVTQTLRAAAGIDYPEKTIYVLDDKGDMRVRDLASRLRLEYLARPVHHDAKAGNLNYAFQRTRGELILTLDADQVPDPKIITKLVGYFRMPRIGFVQTTQSFYVPKGDPFCNSDPVFYGIMQPGKDTDNAAFSCGSGVIYRRAALEQIGGFSTWNLVEDLHTSMLLHDKGWHSIYHDSPLTVGTTPAEIWSIYKQRQQWAADALRILFWDSPFKRKGLSFRQQFQYAHIGFVYLFAGFVMPIFYVLPILTLFTGLAVIETEIWRYLLYRLPVLLLSVLAYKLFVPVPSFYRATNTWLGYFPSFIAATFVALRSRRVKPRYRVTTKTWDLTRPMMRWLGISPQLLLIVLSLVAIPFGFIFHSGNRDLLWISTLWALWTIDTLRWVPIAPFLLKTNERTIPPGPETLRQMNDGGPRNLAVGIHLPDVPPQWQTLHRYEAMLGRTIPFVSFYWAWGHGPSTVPFDWMRALLSRGRWPLVTWEPWKVPEDFNNPLASIEDPRFRLVNILAGHFDDYIRLWATSMKSLPGTIYLRVMHEMNGNWYPWCGTTNENRPHDYAAAWRHIHNIFSEERVPNMQWVWCPYVVSVSDATPISDYFPGDQYVDWLGLDGYNWGGSRPWATWQEFSTLFDAAYATMTALSTKPLMIAEVGCTESGGDKARWIRDAYAHAAASYPRLKAVVWFNLDKECDWRIESSDASLAAFQRSWVRRQEFPSPEDCLRP